MASNEMALWLLEMSVKHLKLFICKYCQPLYMNKKQHKLQYRFQNVSCNVLRCSRVHRVRESLLASFGWFLWVGVVQYRTTLHNIAPPPDFFWWRTSSPTFGHWESKSVKYSSSMIKQRSMRYFLVLKRRWKLIIGDR